MILTSQHIFIFGMCAGAFLCYLATFILPKPTCQWCKREVDRGS